MSAVLRDQHGELYRSIWASDPHYGTAPEWVADTVEHRIGPFMRRHGISGEVVVDFGAGDGRYLVEMQKRGICRMGIGIDYHKPTAVPDGMLWFAQDIAEPMRYRGQAQFAITADTLEHLPPSKVHAALRNIRAAAPHGWARVSLVNDTYGTERGLQLHETLMRSREWIVIFGNYDMHALEYRVYLDAQGQERAIELGW